MNIYAIIILVTLLVGYLLSLITNLLNLKHLSVELRWRQEVLRPC